MIPAAFPFHAEAKADLAASPASVFAALDDHRRLSGHMRRPSWRTAGATMEIVLDERRGRAVGSHIVLQGRILGLQLFVDEIVSEYDPPAHKAWETVGQPRLLVIGPYRMAFDIRESASGSVLRVTIDYHRPLRGLPRILGRLFGRTYAQWCTRQMVTDAQRHFAPPDAPPSVRESPTAVTAPPD